MRKSPISDVTKRAAKSPVFEHVMTETSESFLWRCDDYPWERNVWNIHPEYEIHLVRNAAGIALVGDYIGRFEPGHLAVVGSGLPHDWVSETGADEVIRDRDIVLQFDPTRLRRAAMALPEFLELDAFLTLALRGLSFHGETRRMGADIIEAMGPARGLARFSLFLQLLQLLSQSTDYEILSSNLFTPQIDHGSVSAIKDILKYILDHYTSDLRLADIAAMFGMSESTFSRFFKKNTGHSFTDHVTKLRISRACELLAESHLPVTEICFNVGYSNLSNFNRNFLNQRGSTPSTYRRLARRRTPEPR